jgi:ATP-binding cassette subfamily F protein 3
MLTVRDLTLRRGPEPLFEQASFTIFRGDRVGLTGANGSGKSSLLAALYGDLGPDRGDIERPATLKIAHVEQEIAATQRSAIDFVLDGDAELRAVEAAIAAAERRDAPMALGELHADLLAIDGYRARGRAASIMHGLGFRTQDHGRPVAEFSGGWRVRLAMARALAARSDLLLLDEPTNHLDLDAIVWLEEWLQGYPGTLLMISHDREFLDSIIDRVLHIENREIRAYTGNYSAFERQRALELALQSVLHARQVRRVAEITAFVVRFKAKASKSRQAQSRIKMLERMQTIVPAHVDSRFEFAFERPGKTPRPLLELEGAACGYDSRRVLAGINLTIGPQDRIALVGPNGAGKSTLIQLLAGETAPLDGKRSAAPDLKIGYFAQQQLEQLKLDCDACWHLRRMGGPDYAAGDEQRVRDHLGRFGFRGDRAFDPVGRFSGGEKARLTLALLVARRPNLLLLDEPTNHLDIDMRHALNVALQSFEGGLVVVTHDRHLIKSIADTLWLVADGRLQTFDGDLDDYQQWLRTRAQANAGQSDGKAGAAQATTRRSDGKAGTAQATTRRSDGKAGTAQATTRRSDGKAGTAQATTLPPSGAASVKPRKAANLGPLRRELAAVDKRLAELTAERASLEAVRNRGGAPDPAQARRLAAVNVEITSCEDRWLEIGAAMEAAPLATSETG